MDPRYYADRLPLWQADAALRQAGGAKGGPQGGTRVELRVFAGWHGLC
jgi:hypothetical protein